MNYNIIKDPEELHKFIAWLPELQIGETYYFCLFARSKYCKDPELNLKSSQQLRRFTSTKENIFSMIKQLECEVGNYQQNGKIIPQEALALYMTPNPRSLEKAAKKGLITLAKLITEPYSGYDPRSKMMSEIQRAWSRKLFLNIDFDNNTSLSSVEFISTRCANVLHYINPEAIKTIVTRGGFHLLIEYKKINRGFANTWYSYITDMPEVDVKGDNMIPVPGCTQGGYSPKLIT